jgi:ketosteroid isomerase-like protein
VTPQGNLEVHERAIAAVRAREVPEEILAPRFCMENRVSAVTDYVYHGAMGWRDWMNDVFEVFAEDAVYEVEEVIADGDDFIVAMFRIAGHGARSRMPLELRWVGVTWFRNGKLTRAVGYRSRRQALEAVGLERSGPAPPRR